MIYKIGMLCKHFKGKTLLEKNIYSIEDIEIAGIDVDENKITYTGDKELKKANNLVIYRNIFQENKLFAREYEDILQELSLDKQLEYNQVIKVQPLTNEEINLVNDRTFKEQKLEYINMKYRIKR